MPKEMLINVSEGEECRIALVEDGRLEELYMERSSSTSHVGNIYRGKVTNVEPSIQAAFIDFGLGRNGFLHITDLMPTYFGRNGEDIQETVGRKMARRDRPPIQRCLRRGDEIIVQIIKEGIGTKGPTLSSYLSIPGRILVMMPGMSRLGVSKKIEDDVERRRLRQILDGLKPPKDVGFIIRTAGVGKTKIEIQRDFTYLSRLWMQIEKKLQSTSGPMELYTEGDLVTRTVRDVFTADVDQIIVDNEEVAKRVKEVVKITAPRTKNKVELYAGPVPLFHKYGIEKDIEMMHSRHVPLPSGGSLVIDSTEAIVAIDVNSGKFRDHADAETTAFKTDMEAAEEIPRQLRLRDLGGVIICDFIDLRYTRHKRELEQKLHDKFKHDRAKTKVLPMSDFGIIEMTRQRMRPSLKRSIYFDCPHCKGAGLVKTPESMSLDVMRRLAIAAHDQRVVRVELAVCPEAAFYLQNRKRSQVAEIEEQTKKRIVIKGDASLALDEVKLELYDLRDGLIYLPELGMTPADSQPGRRHGKEQGRPDRGQQQRGRGGRAPEPARRRENTPVDDAFDPDRDPAEDAENAVEEREETREDEAVSAAAVIQPVDERPRSYSNFTDNDVDLGDEDEENAEGDESAEEDDEVSFGGAGAAGGEVDEEDDNDVQPLSNERPPQGRHENRGGKHRRDIVRRDDGRRDQGGRPDNRRDEGSREGNRREEPRRNEQPQRGDQRDQRGDPRRAQQQGAPGGRVPVPQPGNRPPQQSGNRPAQHDPRNRPPQQPGPRNGPQQQGGGQASGRPPQPQGQPRPQGVPQDRSGVGPEGEESGELNALNGEGGGRRRRRRRRGGRGRNRNRQDQPGGPVNDQSGVPSASASFDGYDTPETGEAGAADERARSDESDGFADRPLLNRSDAGDAQERRETEGLFDRTDRDADRLDEVVSVTASDERSERVSLSNAASQESQLVDRSADESNAESPAAEDQTEKPQKQPRSRGGRGRGGKRGGKSRASTAPAENAGVEARTDTPERASEAESPAVEKAAAKPRRAASPKGARSGSRGGAKKGKAATSAPAEVIVAAAEAAAPVIRTGSTDRHQLIVDEVADEPILLPEPRRPRTYRDLDEIPDDLD